MGEQLQLTRGQVWQDIGSTQLSGQAIANLFRIYGCEALKQSSILNSIFAYFLTMLDQGVTDYKNNSLEQDAIELLETLLQLLAFDREHRAMSPYQVNF